jgi:tRNA threonylcarbamoyl adenosine modification protein (Sua5/YciO/YrdC/YwlC family)
MAQFFQIHAENPQQRFIQQAAGIIRKGGLVVYPTDSAYALGCQIGNKEALERICVLRKLDKDHNFTLMCRNISELATYARVDNHAYRLIKNHTPGAYTFILESTSEVPRRLMHPKRKTIGLRVPDNRIALALLEDMGEPIMTSSLLMPGEEFPMTDPYDMRDSLVHHVDLIIDGGYCGIEPTTIIDLTGDVPVLVRQGKGDFAPFGG